MFAQSAEKNSGNMSAAARIAALPQPMDVETGIESSLWS